MQTYINKGYDVRVTLAADVKAGDLVAVGTTGSDRLVGVAFGDGKSGDAIAIATHGVFRVKKTAAQAMTQGQMLYLNPSTGAATTAKDDGATPAVAFPEIGRCWASELAAATTVLVKLKGN